MSTPTDAAGAVPARRGLAARAGLGLMRLLALLPLRWVRALGWLTGQLLYLVAQRRRRIALVNWALCFPQQGAAECRRAVRRHFVLFAQSWLDRAWVWEGTEAMVRRRTRVVGDLQALAADGPVLLFAPHFVGLDAGGAAIALAFSRPFISLYARQRNPAIDRWIRKGRVRFGAVRLVEKHQSLRALVQALRQGEALYLLPDQDMGPSESLFVPFFGVPTATVPTLSRLAQMGRARVVPVVSRLTPDGYEAELMPAWKDFPSGDVAADTARMNRELEALIQPTPEQYYWLHKRFKTRPAGEPSPYPLR